MNTDDLRQRTFQFGIRCIKLVEALPKKSAAGDILAITISSIKTARTNTKPTSKK